MREEELIVHYSKVHSWDTSVSHTSRHHMLTNSVDSLYIESSSLIIRTRPQVSQAYSPFTSPDKLEPLLHIVMQLSFCTLDVFTTTRYTGNPLALVLVDPSDEKHLTQDLKQKIAREFNLSETAFLHLHPPAASSSSSASQHDDVMYILDIFTTTAELPFAGHPTIGTACYILNHLLTSTDTAIISTKSGKIPISRFGQGGVSAEIAHDVHLHSRNLKDMRDAGERMYDKLISSISEVREAESAKGVKLVSIVKGMTFLCVPLPNLETLALVRYENSPQTAQEWGLDAGWNEGFIGKYYFCIDERTRQNEGEEVVEIRTRMMGDMMEDPATGSAACALGCWLTLQRGMPGITVRYEITQGAEMGRDSVIHVEVKLGTGRELRIEGVKLSGNAVIVQCGTIELE